MASLIGRKLGQYEVVEILGKGGMATVYKGYQTSIGRHVAIKVLPPHPGLDDDFIRRFELEARTIGGLQHPHILPLYDYGTEDNILYLVMQYADGGTLSDLVQDGPMDMKLVERIVRECASALDYAHRRGIVHRDIKPANILLDGEMHSRLADFGIVKMVGGANLTGTGIVGTPAYMAPEQGQGMDVDGRADVYALGCMAFEMMTGYQPFTGDTPMQVILRHISDPIPDIRQYRSDLPEGVHRVFRKVLAKEPGQRYQTGVEFAEALTDALHADESSLAAVRAATPLEALDNRPITPANSPTMQQRTFIDSQPGAPQTIIMRDSTNPLVLMGGFGLIALVIVVVAVMLIGQQNQGGAGTTGDDAASTPATTEATAVAALPQATTQPNFGTLRYASQNTLGDTINLRLQGVARPAQGSRYAAWLANTASGETLLLGEIITDSFGEGLLVFTTTDGRILPAEFNAVYISEEQTIGATPSGPVKYSGAVPVEVAASLTSIFLEDERGLNGGSLIAGAQAEATFASQHAGLAARATTLGGIRQHAEHTINILRGTRDDLDGDGRGTNPGRGVGVYFFLDAIELSLQAAIDAQPNNINVQNNAEFIRICAQNVRDWADQVVDLELQLIQIENVPDADPINISATRLADALINGIDANEDGQIDAFEGECGLSQMPEYGAQFGNVEIYEGNIGDA